VFVLAVAGITASGGSALAAGDGGVGARGNICSSWQAWGHACYESHGDHLRVLDRKADGKWVKAVAETSSGKLLVCEDHSSEGGWLDCNNNISEKEKVRVRAELWNGGDFITATGWSQWVSA
jgi:hypothetical protein